MVSDDIRFDQMDINSIAMTNDELHKVVKYMNLEKRLEFEVRGSYDGPDGNGNGNGNGERKNKNQISMKELELNELKTQKVEKGAKSTSNKKEDPDPDLEDEDEDEDEESDKDKIIEKLKNKMDKMKRDLNKLRMENERLKREKCDKQQMTTKNIHNNECVVCMDGIRLYAFIPCGHLCLCYKCMKLIENDINETCLFVKMSMNH